MTPVIAGSRLRRNSGTDRAAAASALLFLFLFLPSSISATTWTIAPAGPLTIQDAVNAAAVSGDTILLQPGTFSGAGNHNIIMQGKQFVITSTAGADMTIIDCESEGPAFDITDLPAGITAVTNLTIRNARAASKVNGGAIHVGAGEPGASMLILGNIFTANQTSGQYNIGGAIAIDNLVCTIEDNLFESNLSLYAGGAVAATGADVTIEGNEFRGNAASWCTIDFCNGRGGAISLTNSRGVIAGNLFLDNHGDEWGGALHCVDDTLMVRRNTFDGNYSVGKPWERGGGGAIHLTGGTVAIEQNFFLQNSANAYGGGALWIGPGEHTVSGNTFYDNFAWSSGPGGSAILVQDGIPLIETSIFALNRTASSGHTIICLGSGSPEIACSDFFANEPDNSIGMFSGGAVTDTINRDPLFCNVEVRDYRIDYASPCVPGHNACGVLMGAFSPKCGVISVLFQSFDSEVVADGVLLRWTIFADEDIFELRVYRSANGGNEYSLTGTIKDIARHEFLDGDVVPGSDYSYTLAAVKSDGTQIESGALHVHIPAAAFTLYQNRPNPFTAATSIEFVLDAPGWVNLAVFDVGGRLVAKLISSRLPAGRHEYRLGDAGAFDCRASGIYFYRLEVEGRTLSRKMIFIH